MERYLLDLENLPKAKKEVILQITSPLTEQGKTAFVRSLIFLGFAEIKQSEIDVDNANIGKSKHPKPCRVRVVLTNTIISKFLEKYPDQNSKRSCVYAFLYAGVNCFIDYMEILEKSKNEKELKPKNEKELKRIEKNLFLCGLGEYFHSEVKLTISQSLPSPPPQQPEVKQNKPVDQPEPLVNKPEPLVNIGNQPDMDDKPKESNQPEAIVEKPKSNRKPVVLTNFNIDGF